MTLLIRFLLILALVIGVVAPFTFLEPQSLISEGESSDITITSSSTKEPLPPRKTNKAVVVQKQSKSKPSIDLINEKPLHQVSLPDFKAIADIPTKKRQFFGFILPAVENKNKQLASDRKQLISWQEKTILGIRLSDDESVALNKLMKAYRVDDKASILNIINQLLDHVDIIPSSLVLVQAANESAWGTSRFARIGLNFFGIWCYKRGCGMVPGGRDTGAKHEVAAFQSVDAAVSGYFNNINKHSAYREFRVIRSALRAENKPLSSESLAQGLMPYSERGEEYVADIITMIRQNQRYLPIEAIPADITPKESFSIENKSQVTQVNNEGNIDSKEVDIEFSGTEEANIQFVDAPLEGIQINNDEVKQESVTTVKQAASAG